MTRFRKNASSSALDFTKSRKTVRCALEEQGHHVLCDIYLAWGKVKVTVWTHKIDGLTVDDDFVFAAKSDFLRCKGNISHLQCGGPEGVKLRPLLF